MAVSIDLKVDSDELVRELQREGQKWAKQMEWATKDMRRAAPTIVANHTVQRYAIKKGEVNANSKSFVGGCKMSGGIASLRLDYSGRMLTPTHFKMAPSAAPAGGRKYAIKATVLKGRRVEIGRWQSPWSAGGTYGNPALGNWAKLFYDQKELGNSKVYYCPSIKPTSRAYEVNGTESCVTQPTWAYTYKFISYGYNWKYFGSNGTASGVNQTAKYNRIKNPSGKITHAEARYGSTRNGCYIVTNSSTTGDGRPDPRHSEKMPGYGTINLLFADSHVEAFVNFSDVAQETSEMRDKYWDAAK